ncbi:hypothetical protein G3I24_29415, partial [Micromonospora aurantiaca]|nr:hypothetical protein [Micromonospora aurantiaca]
MGDALAWRFLNRHVIREMARGRLRPPSLKGQGQDFDYVLDVAEDIAGAGLAPIIADLTHLISVGDVIVAAPEVITILECKNSSSFNHKPQGRHARQQERALMAADYLADGIITTNEGMDRISIDLDLPEPDTDSLHKCIKAAQDSSLGAAFTEIDERDLILVIWPGELESDEVLDCLGMDFTDWKDPAIAFFSDAVDVPTPFRMNPYAAALPAPF